MFCNRFLNNKIDLLHKGCRRIIYCDKILSFSELLEKDGPASIHHHNIRKFAIEMFIVFNSGSPEIIKEILQFRGEVPYSLKHRSQFYVAPVHKFFNGTENIKFLKIWKHVPFEMK